MYFTFNKLEEGNLYNDYVEKKRKYFPPPNERTNLKISSENNNLFVYRNSYNYYYKN